MSQSVGLGVQDELGGLGSFLSRQVRKTVHVVEDIARPVTAAAQGDFGDAARALKNGIVATVATPYALAVQVATGNAPDIEAARDTSIRVADRIASAAMDAIRTAVRAAARPVVHGFMNGEDLCFGTDAEAATKSEIKNVATVAALPVTTAAAAAAGSAFPAVGTVTAAGLAASLTPPIVSDIVDELWDAGKKQIDSALKSGVPNEPAAAAGLAADAKKKQQNTILLVGGGALLIYLATHKSKRGKK